MNKKAGIIKIIAGPLVFLFMEAIGRPSSMGADAYHVLASTTWVAIWWVTEAVPIAVTALLPLVLFPLTGALDMSTTSASFGHKYIFLYLGGFIIAIAIEKWNLHRRIALNIIYIIGSDLSRIVLGFMVATGFLSMWISNTATSVMMLPIGIAIVKQFKTGHSDGHGESFGKALMLSIAYSASLGGFATLIGTPPNLVLAGIFEQIYEVKISFFQWIIFGFPLSMFLIIICWKYLTRFAFDFRGVHFPGGREEIAAMRKALGKITYEEKSVLVVFLVTAVCWMSRALIEKLVPAIDDSIIALSAGITLFVLPTNGKGRKIIKWEEATKLPWGIILLFGGGMALAKGFTETGLANWIAEQLTQLDNLSLLLLILTLVAVVNFLTEITSNLATTAMLLPVLAPMALSFDLHPFMIMVPVSIAASCAFMLPVATPPNAVVFGSGYLRIPDMIKTGITMNIISIILVSIITYFLLPVIWGIDPQSFPEFYAKPNN